jgi:hypothetical protein
MDITMSFCPPRIKDGYLSREAIDDFFLQVYPEANLLVQHAGGLHTRLVNAVWFNAIDLDMRCQHCRGDIRTPSCISKIPNHMGEMERKNMEILVSSLSNLSAQQFEVAAKRVGPAALYDFELLRNNL